LITYAMAGPRRTRYTRCRRLISGWWAVVTVRLKGINKVRKRLADGTIRVHFYHRRTGRKLQGEPGSADFSASYAEAERAHIQGPENTLAGLIVKYTASPDFTALRDTTRTEYKRMLRSIEDEWGSMPLAAVSDPKARGAFLGWRDQVANQRGLREAENRVTIFARVLAWSVDRALIVANPLATWERKYKADRADKIWTPHHIEAFARAASPELRLALYVALYTGQRQADLLKLTWSQYRDGKLYIRQGKGHQHVEVPCIEPVRLMLDELRSRPLLSTHILTTQNGRPWLKRHFSRQFRECCDKAGVTGLTFHDLRGTAVTLLAEAGCDVPQIAAITGHTLRSASAILEKYMARTRAQGVAAMAKLENYLRTNLQTALQTVGGSEG
jgi:integrase